MIHSYHDNGDDDADADSDAGDDTVDTDWIPADACNIGLWLTPVVTGAVCCCWLTPAETGR